MPEKPKSNAAPASVRLTNEEVEKLRKIAVTLGVSEHNLRHYAISRLIRDYENGTWKPKKRRKKKIAVNELELEE